MNNKINELNDEKTILLTELKRAAKYRDSRDPMIADRVQRLAVINVLLAMLEDGE